MKAQIKKIEVGILKDVIKQSHNVSNDTITELCNELLLNPNDKVWLVPSSHTGWGHTYEINEEVYDMDFFEELKYDIMYLRDKNKLQLA